MGPQLLDARRLLLKVETVARNRLTGRYQSLGKRRRAFYEQLWNLTAAKLGAEATAAGSGFIRIERDGAVVFATEGGVGLDNYVSLSVVADKTVTLRLLEGLAGFRSADYVEVSLANLEAGFSLLERHGRVVVKPAADTGAGKGVSMGVTTPKALQRAAVHASLYRNRILVEQELRGHSFRLLFLDGELLSAIRRDPPTVCGDGRTSLRRLIAQENAQRLGPGTHTSLNLLEIDPDCRATLAEQRMSLADTPNRGEVVVVKRVPNQNQARENHLIAAVHPSFLEFGPAIARLTGLRLYGLDVLTHDLGLPLTESHGAINEVNGTPGLHHHYLVSSPDSAPDVALRIVEAALQQARELAR